ncbi:MAG TPA: ABC transporter substrate-binding protein [Gemmatimonadales bacterium]|jgi:branched-chain amino acid transport system substrate-binding protein|nr:ABC transporter substrate-binding protein [Gemmatimonadales bacterium]
MNAPDARRGILLLTMLAAACGRSPRAATIGLAYAPGWRSNDAARLAMSDLDAAHHAHTVRLLLDSTLAGDSAQVEVRRAERLVADPSVMTVIGPSNSRGALAAAPIYNAAGVTQINPQATSYLLARLDGRTLSLIPDDSLEGEFIGMFLADSLHARSATIFFANDEYGIGLREGVEHALSNRQIQVADKVPFSESGPFQVLVRSSLQRVHPDVFVIAGRSSATVEIARALHEVIPGAAIVVGDGAMVPERLATLGDSILASLHVVSFWVAQPGDTAAAEFSRRFRALLGRDPEPADAYVYDGIMLSAAAIDAAGADRDAVWEWIQSLGTSRPPYHGVTGSIAFNEPPLSRMVMVQIRDGQVEAEWRR